MKSQQHAIIRIWRGALSACLFATMACAAQSSAAQQSPYLDWGDPSVQVDLSIHGPGYSPIYGLPGRPAHGLLMPGVQPPLSALHIAVPPGADSATLRLPPPIAQTEIAKIIAPAAPPPLEPKPPLVNKAMPTPVQPPEQEPPKVAVSTKPASPPHLIATPARPAKAPEAAARSPATNATAADGPYRVVFTNEDTRLPEGAYEPLRAISAGLKDQQERRLLLMAYAGGEGLSSSKARRLSLSQALSVRTFLIENGAHSTRIDLRALGNKAIENPVNYVDVIVIER